MPLDELTSNLIHRVNVGDSLTRTAARSPRALAIVDGARRLDYSEFNSAVNRLAHSLLVHGIAVGDAVALASHNSAEFLICYYACAKIGAVCVPINLAWRPHESAYVLADSRARVLVVHTELASEMAQALDNASTIELIVTIGPSDVAFDTPTTEWEAFTTGSAETDPTVTIGDRAALTYLYTSGTTSAPKGVVGNHTAIYLESMTMIIEGGFRPDDRFAALLPIFHTAQLNCHCTTAVMVGAAIFVMRGFDAEALLTLIEQESITQLFGLPMMYRAMLERADIRRRNLSSVRRALYAMAPMPQDILEECIEVFDCDFYLLFGQTEMSPTATIFRPENQLTHPGAVGTPVINVQVEIHDDAGRALPTGTDGEIVYRGPHLMTEYLGKPDDTDEAFRHGWFHSGDVGHFDSDGILWFTDRHKDVIKTGGENVSSLEVEKAMYSAEPAVAEAVVVGLPHAHWSEAITAFVVGKPGLRLDENDIREKLRQHLDAYKIPKAIVVVDELPKTATGKIRKNEIRGAHRDFYAR
ncbi:putative long-chain-fatty-acid--CoA ligase [Gordonia polyisoprenivorans NBRC 16320 = JCM 10675]|uniref:Long-chain-fatty-acid--CoA ligase n=1 Tax=Gordonia polyisoprenivorans TaxID=84595 RepID=A0A846WX24_9ACTN|nr:long-chain-fatty-acid--CoA ligase [Gordonia polyisoprenivorans]NKY05193.1 long-chain-fatty-acid--CoA ligase [Gordonia polyisoprenivorans]GAB24070.1 putative long-chain-fatty-acid--CoA ligase [Gordonia polyisoprenivorans NBRC 16320 = JCM 10675]